MEDERFERAWGVELWDQSDQLLNFTSEQNAVTLSYLNMLTDVQKMHHDIAKKYKKTVAPYMAKKNIEAELSYQSILNKYAQTYYDMAGLHEKLADSINEKIISVFKAMSEDQKQFITNKNKKRAELVGALEDKRKILNKSWDAYVKAHREKQQAAEQNKKAQNDQHLPRSEVARFEEIYKLRTQECEQASMRYAQDLRNYNEHCTKFYTQKNMDFITEIEELNVTRTEKTKEILEQASDLHIEAYGRLLDSCSVSKSVVGLLDDKKDRVAVLNKLRSDYHYPAEVCFLDLDACPQKLLTGPLSKLVATLLGEEVKPKEENVKTNSGFHLFSKSVRKKEEMVSLANPFFGGLGIKPIKLEDFTVLQADRRIVALESRYQHLNRELEASNEMVKIYSADPKLGCADSVNKRVSGYNRQLRSLEISKEALEKRYKELGGDNAKIECIKRLELTSHPSSSSSDSAYKSETGIYETIDKEFSSSDEEDENGAANTMPTPSAPDSNTYVGKGTALYNYDGNGENYLAMKEGQEFEIISFDSDQTGWTCVYNTASNLEGYVPTDFIKITRY